MIRGVAIDLIGQRFDKLTVIDKLAMTKSGAVWLCRCDCGGERQLLTTQLRRGGFKGCKACEPLSRAKVHLVHGGSFGGKSTLYNVWKGMRHRCHTPSSTSWKYYGLKGIGICEEWNSFASFRTWAMEHGYQPGLSIDRLDPSLDYSPDNCEIVTRSENSRRAHTARHLAV